MLTHPALSGILLFKSIKLKLVPKKIAGIKNVRRTYLKKKTVNY